MFLLYNARMDMHTRHNQNRERNKIAFAALQSMGMVPKSKMWKFYKNVSNGWNQLDSEFVECRRVQKTTLRYQELEQNYNECITVFEQYSLIAALQYA